MDLIKATPSACSPEVRNRAQKLYEDYRQRLANVKIMQDSPEKAEAISRLEARLKQLAPLALVKDQTRSGGSSSRVAAPGPEGDQGETVDIEQEKRTITMDDGTEIPVVLNKANLQGKAYTARELDREARRVATEIYDHQQKHGIQFVPARGKAASKSGTRRKSANLKDRKPGFHIRKRATNRETGDQIAYVDHVGEDGKILATGRVVAREGRDGETLSPSAIRNLAKQRVQDSESDAPVSDPEGGEGKVQRKRPEGKPEVELSKISKFEDLPHHQKADMPAHSMGYSEYRKAVNTFYRSNRVEESVKKTAEKAIGELRRKSRPKFRDASTRQEKAELQRKFKEDVAKIEKKRDQILSEVRDRVSDKRLKEEHMDALTEATRLKKDGTFMYPELANRVPKALAQQYDLPYTKRITTKDKKGNPKREFVVVNPAEEKKAAQAKAEADQKKGKIIYGDKHHSIKQSARNHFGALSDVVFGGKKSIDWTPHSEEGTTQKIKSHEAFTPPDITRHGETREEVMTREVNPRGLRAEDKTQVENLRPWLKKQLLPILEGSKTSNLNELGLKEDLVDEMLAEWAGIKSEHKGSAEKLKTKRDRLITQMAGKHIPEYGTTARESLYHRMTGHKQDLRGEELEDHVDQKLTTGSRRGRTDFQSANRELWEDWTKGVKRQLASIRSKALKEEGINPLTDKDLPEDKRAFLKEYEKEEAAFIEKLIDSVGLGKPKTEQQMIDVLAEDEQDPRVTEYARGLNKLGKDQIRSLLRKSFDMVLDMKVKDIFPGVFLNIDLFKNFNASEKDKVRAFRNSFGRDTSGVNPSTMNSEIEGKEEDEDSETKKSLGLYLDLNKAEQEFELTPPPKELLRLQTFDRPPTKRELRAQKKAEIRQARKAKRSEKRAARLALRKQRRTSRLAARKERAEKRATRRFNKDYASYRKKHSILGSPKLPRQDVSEDQPFRYKLSEQPAAKIAERKMGMKAPQQPQSTKPVPTVVPAPKTSLKAQPKAASPTPKPSPGEETYMKVRRSGPSGTSTKVIESSGGEVTRRESK